MRDDCFFKDISTMKGWFISLAAATEPGKDGSGMDDRVVRTLLRARKSFSSTLNRMPHTPEAQHTKKSRLKLKLL